MGPGRGGRRRQGTRAPLARDRGVDELEPGHPGRRGGLGGPLEPRRAAAAGGAARLVRARRRRARRVEGGAGLGRHPAPPDPGRARGARQPRLGARRRLRGRAAPGNAPDPGGVLRPPQGRGAAHDPAPPARAPLPALLDGAGGLAARRPGVDDRAAARGRARARRRARPDGLPVRGGARPGPPLLAPLRRGRRPPRPPPRDDGRRRPRSGRAAPLGAAGRGLRGAHVRAALRGRVRHRHAQRALLRLLLDALHRARAALALRGGEPARPREPGLLVRRRAEPRRPPRPAVHGAVRAARRRRLVPPLGALPALARGGRARDRDRGEGPPRRRPALHPLDAGAARVAALDGLGQLLQLRLHVDLRALRDARAARSARHARARARRRRGRRSRRLGDDGADRPAHRDRPGVRARLVLLRRPLPARPRRGRRTLDGARAARPGRVRRRLRRHDARHRRRLDPAVARPGPPARALLGRLHGRQLRRPSARRARRRLARARRSGCARRSGSRRSAGSGACSSCSPRPCRGCTSCPSRPQRERRPARPLPVLVGRRRTGADGARDLDARRAARPCGSCC